MHKVLEPLVQQHVSVPAPVELGTTGTPQVPELYMPTFVRVTHRFREAAVEINPDNHIRVGHAL
jgi:hypothetical protein